MNRKIIALSPRRDEIFGRKECRDSVDVRMFEFFWKLGFSPVLLGTHISDVHSYLRTISPGGLVLTGGNDIGEVPERDNLEIQMLDYSLVNGIPLLGICRGMQMINHYQGGTLVAVEGHVAKNHIITGKLTNNERRIVNSFHKYGILPTTIGRDLQVAAVSDDGVVEALNHSNFQWLGVMWHPERGKQFAHQDKKIIANHFGGEI